MITGNTVTYIAGGSINANKVCRVSTTEDNTIHHDTAATTPCVGVSLNSASDGEAVTVQVDGIARIKANAQLTKNALVKPDTGGGIRTTTTAGNTVVGVVLQSTTQTETTGGIEIVNVDLTNRNTRY